MIHAFHSIRKLFFTPFPRALEDVANRKKAKDFGRASNDLDFSACALLTVDIAAQVFDNPTYRNLRM
jgi:hypothetical protein